MARERDSERELHQSKSRDTSQHAFSTNKETELETATMIVLLAINIGHDGDCHSLSILSIESFINMIKSLWLMQHRSQHLVSLLAKTARTTCFFL